MVGACNNNYNNYISDITVADAGSPQGAEEVRNDHMLRGNKNAVSSLIYFA